MAIEETKTKKQGEEIETVEIPEQESGLSPQGEKPLEDIKKALSPYVSFLEAMRTVKAHVDVAPTFTPKNFYEQIQFYDDGATRRIYIYINGDWRYVALT